MEIALFRSFWHAAGARSEKVAPKAFFFDGNVFRKKLFRWSNIIENMSLDPKQHPGSLLRHSTTVWNDLRKIDFFNFGSIFEAFISTFCSFCLVLAYGKYLKWDILRKKYYFTKSYGAKFYICVYFTPLKGGDTSAHVAVGKNLKTCMEIALFRSFWHAAGARSEKVAPKAIFSMEIVFLKKIG